MTKKKVQEDDPDQSERFRQSLRDLEAAGELNPTDGDEAIERILRANQADQKQ